MDTETIILTLEKSEIDFLEMYALEHGHSVSEFIAEYIHRLQQIMTLPVHEDVKKITGILPKELNAIEEYERYLLKKHS